MNEKVDIEIFRRKLSVEIEGLTPLEISDLSRRVSDKMTEIAEQNNKIADSSKLAILTALAFAAELSKAKEAHETEKLVIERKVDELNLIMQTALSASGTRSK